MMKKSSVFLLASAFVLAVGVALLARALLAPPPQPVIVQESVKPIEATPPKRKILYVTKDLYPGDFIDAGSFTLKEEPDEVMGEYVQDRSQLQGATIRRELRAGEPVTADVLLRNGEPGFMAAVLKPGMRAVSIPTSRAESNFGFAAPGDRVDVILGLKRQDSPVENDPSVSITPFLASETILQDVRVLALNDQTFQAPSEKGADKKRKNARFETVTLEVQPLDAERLMVAKEVGTMQLALRSAREGEGVDVSMEGVTALDDGDDMDLNGVTTLDITTQVYSAFKPKSVGGPSTVSVQTFKGSSAEQLSLAK
ncbi:Flp pilus assembly protein CpaB [Terasakiella pusilla]|uniref:Flp pilus assembly protein CpaB n=1 Tax=Terasakiella pusilla TaxID=64973 RepID=UPI003AA9D590